ncbi:hypothetical protein JXA88_04475 [Candidatus Fermentibacteria bacterium]|nr:hypothetical protein [Candidatus Fermentibacteria bacterium]
MEHTLSMSPRAVTDVVLVLLCAGMLQNAYATPSRDGGRALLRSAVLPGWGQVTAGSTVKGVVFLALSASLAYGHIRASDLSSGQRRELNRWTVLFWVYNLGDAYVDGYLRSFDREMQEMDGIGTGLVDDAQVSPAMDIGISLRW